VLGVREPALVAIMSILRVRVFTVVATGDNFTSRGEDEARQLAKELRAYWKEYGRFPFDERMMKVLTDPKARPEAWQEAAVNLARLDKPVRPLSTMVAPVVIGRVSPRAKPNPAIAKFRNPTVAEAILAAMDRDLKAHDARKRDHLYEYERSHIERTYAGALAELGDRRVVLLAVERWRRAKGESRRRWAAVCHALGEPKPLRDQKESPSGEGEND
jgi:hypothetical protein